MNRSIESSVQIAQSADRNAAASAKPAPPAHSAVSVRLYLLLLISAGLVMGGLAGRSFSILLLAAPLLVYLAAAVLLSPGRVDVGLRRSLCIITPGGAEQANPLNRPERIVPSGSRVTVTVSAANPSRALPEIHLMDETWGFSTTMTAGAQAEYEYTFIPPRGRRAFKPILVTASDPFGLFPHQAVLPADTDGHADARLLVLPGGLPLRRVPVRPPVLRGFAGPVAARAPGSGTDFFDLREYQPGDPQRRINWRVSSKSDGGLYTNQYEGERFADIGLILDARQSRNLLGKQGELFEHSLLATASLGEAFIRDGHRVSLLVYGFSMERVLPGTGRLQIERIQRLLAVAQPLHNYALDNLRYLPARLFPPRSQIVFVSPLGDEDVSPLARFRMMGYDVLVISPDPVSFEARNSPAGDHGSEDGRHALRLARLERALLIRRLERLGVWTVDWRVEQPLSAALRLGLDPIRHGQRWRWRPI